MCRRQLVGRHESAAWLNALIASGWASTLGPLLEQSLRDEIRASLAELPLPRSLRSVHLARLDIGSEPPLVRTVACAPLPRGTVFSGEGCEAQLDLEWEDEAASATYLNPNPYPNPNPSPNPSPNPNPNPSPNPSPSPNPNQAGRVSGRRSRAASRPLATSSG